MREECKDGGIKGETETEREREIRYDTEEEVEYRWKK